MFLGKSQHYAHVHRPWRIFGTPKKSENYQNTVISGCAGCCVFFAGVCGFFAGFLRGFASFLPDRLRRCKYCLSFVSPSSKTCNQSPKIEDLGVSGKISWYRSNSENTYIFLGFGWIWRVQVYYRRPNCMSFSSERCYLTAQMQFAKQELWSDLCPKSGKYFFSTSSFCVSPSDPSCSTFLEKSAPGLAGNVYCPFGLMSPCRKPPNIPHLYLRLWCNVKVRYVMVMMVQ